MTLRCKSLLRLIKSFAVALLLATALSAPAFANCTNTSTVTCSYVPAGTSVEVSPTAFSSPSPSCKKVYDGCALAIVVPTETQAEWTSFVNNHESCASLSSCSATSCNPSSVANGSVGAFPNCTVTCNNGYTYSNGNCVSDATDITYAWSDWGSCNATCSGTQTRTCNGSDGSTSNDPSLCGGGDTMQSCNTQVTFGVSSNFCAGVYCGYGNAGTDTATLNEICVLNNCHTALSFATNAATPPGAGCSGCTYALWTGGGGWDIIAGKWNSGSAVTSVTCQ